LDTVISGTLNLGLSTFICNGNLNVSATGTINMNGQSAILRPQLRMADNTSIVINGAFNTTWTLPNLKPVITSTTTGARYAFTVNGKIDAQGLIIASVNINGLTINDSADKTSDIDDVDFQDVPNGGRHLYIGFTSGSYLGNYDGCSFDNSFAGGNNLVCTPTGGSTVIYFSRWSGAGGGELYESQGTNTDIVWIITDSVLASSPASIILEGTSAITVPGDFNIEVVTCTGSASIYLPGIWGVVTFTPGTSTVCFNGGTQTITSSSTSIFYNLVVQSSDAKTPSGTNVVITPTGSLNISAHSASISGSYTVDNSTITLGQNVAVNVNSNAKLKAINNSVLTSSNPGTDRFDFNVSGEIELNNCYITSTTSPGLNIQSGAIINALNNVKFYSHPDVADGRFLSIALSNQNRDFLGCYFDTITDTIPTCYNVSATGVSSILRFELYGAGPGAGELKDYDDDADNDGISDTGGAVVLWVQRSALNAGISGGIQGFPQVAFDINTLAYYSTYVTSRDLTGVSTTDRLYALDGNGSVKYYYDVRQTYGDIVFTPWYWTEGTDHTVYFGTTQGYLFRLKDTGSALTLSPGWPIKVCSEITSAVISDGINLYFGGMDGTQARIYAYIISSVSQRFAIDVVSRVSAAPSWAVDGGITYLFIGSDFNIVSNGTDGVVKNTKKTLNSATSTFQTNGVAANDVVAISSGGQQGWYNVVSVDSETQITTDHIFSAESGLSFAIGHQRPLLYRVNVIDKVIDTQNNSPLDSVRAPTVYWEWAGTKVLFAGDYAGWMQGVDPFSATFTNTAGFPAVPTQLSPSGAPYSITTMACVMGLTPGAYRLLYADMGGYLYDRNSDGALYNPGSGAYPIRLGGGFPIESAPLSNNTGLIYVGNNDGKVFVVNESTKMVSRTYSFGSGIKIGDISYDFENSRYLVPASNGKVYYLD
jgi:hypothetical protein